MNCNPGNTQYLMEKCGELPSTGLDLIDVVIAAVILTVIGGIGWHLTR